MSTDIERVTLDWGALVAEAVRRRKTEGLTQREHAALAGVSAPTIIAFDRGETSLTLAKAFDILRVVGLVGGRTAADAQQIFVRDAHQRWRNLTAKLSDRSPARFPNGWYRIDYSLDGELYPFEPHQLLEPLAKAVTHHTGWPPFWVPTRQELIPREIDGVIECWLAPSETGIERMGEDPAHCDFWRAAPTGRMFLLRGYQEDGQETFSPGTIFDTTLPIWRIGEALLHSANLARLMAPHPDSVTVRFRAMYTGIKGRELRSWANPIGGTLVIEGERAKSDEAIMETAVLSSQIEATLDEHVLALVRPLYERFGIGALSKDFVAAELARMLRNRV